MLRRTTTKMVFTTLRSAQARRLITNHTTNHTTNNSIASLKLMKATKTVATVGLVGGGLIYVGNQFLAAASPSYAVALLQHREARRRQIEQKIQQVDDFFFPSKKAKREEEIKNREIQKKNNELAKLADTVIDEKIPSLLSTVMDDLGFSDSKAAARAVYLLQEMSLDKNYVFLKKDATKDEILESIKSLISTIKSENEEINYHGLETFVGTASLKQPGFLQVCVDDVNGGIKYGNYNYELQTRHEQLMKVAEIFGVQLDNTLNFKKENHCHWTNAEKFNSNVMMLNSALEKIVLEKTAGLVERSVRYVKSMF